MRGLDPRIHPLCKQRALLRWIAGSSPAMTKSERWAPSIPSPRRISAVGVEDVPGVEVRRPRGEEQERAGEVRRLAEPAFGHAGEEALADVAGAFGVLVHPCGQRRAEDRRPQRIDRDAGFAELAAQRLGDAVDRRFRCAISGVAGRMSQQPARRGSQDDLAAEAIAVLALLEHLPGGGARHQPGLGDVGVHHVEEIFRLLVDDLRYLVEAGGDHQDVEPAEGRHRGGDDRFATIAVTIVLLPPSAWHSAATFLSSSSRLAASATLAPAPASTLAASEPNAPDAPVTIAVLPRMSNREAGFFRKSSDIGFPRRRTVARMERSVMRELLTLPCRGRVGSPKAIRGGVTRRSMCGSAATPSRPLRGRPPPSRGR